MNISEIYGDMAARPADLKISTQESGADSWFRAGAILEGVVTKLGAETTTVSFGRNNGDAAVSSVVTEKKDIDFPKEQVKDAYVGEKRHYEVVSSGKGQVKLKELKNGGGGRFGISPAISVVEGNAAQVLETLSENTGIAPKESTDSLKRLTDEDYSKMDEEGFSLEKYKSERLERAMERIKAGRAVKEAMIDEAVATGRKRTEDIKNISEGGASSDGTRRRIVEALKNADLPVTEENIAGVLAAADMMKNSGPLNDNSMAYILKNNLDPSIDNVYKSMYTGTYTTKKIPESAWKDMTNSVERVLWQAKELIDVEDKEDAEISSMTYGAEKAVQGLLGEQPHMPLMKDARWMMEHDIPVTPEMMVKKLRLTEFSVKMEQMSDDEKRNIAIQASVKALSNDKMPTDGLVLDRDAAHEKSIYNVVSGVLRHTAMISDMAVRYVARGGRSNSGSVNNTEDISIRILSEAEEILEDSPEVASAVAGDPMTADEIGVKLRLEEIRLKLTLESGRRLMAKGIDLANEGLGRIVSGLRELEKDYYRALREEVGVSGNIEGTDEIFSEDEEIEIAAETDSGIKSIKNAPAGFVGATFAGRNVMTLRELSRQAAAMRDRVLADNSDAFTEKVEIRGSINSALDYYEASATQVRGDLGDSMGKAFGNIDSLIEDAGVTVTDASRRAVRILGYNSMPVTKENIEGIKAYDATLRSLTSKMTPPVVMSMIRNGINPLDRTAAELEKEADRITKEYAVGPEKKYSEFLVDMEENGGISDTERQAYIGIYRLLYTAEKSEGAAIGALFKSGMELNLRNLLTEARTMATHIDASADDVSEIRSSSYTNSISSQIENAFVKLGESEVYDYNLRLAEGILDRTSSSVWQNMLQGENIENLSLEQLSEKLNSADNIISSGAASQLRNLMTTSTGTKKFLKAFGVDDSYTNILAAEAEFEADDVGGSVLGSISKDELLNALDGKEGADSLLEERITAAENGIGASFLNGPDGATARSLTEQLDRIGLIKKLGEGGQYRFMMENENGIPAKINLTIISNTGDAGTVSMQLTTDTYTVKADLHLTVMLNEYGAGAISGRHYKNAVTGAVTGDNVTGMAELEKPMLSFVNSLNGMGYNTDGISLRTTYESSSRFNGHVAQTKTAANPGGGHSGSTNALYRIAKNFVAAFA